MDMPLEIIGFGIMILTTPNYVSFFGRTIIAIH